MGGMMGGMGGGMMGGGGGRAALPGVLSDEPMQSQQADPRGLLQQAIQLHAQHISGAVPPSPESQEEMMQMMQAALQALG